MNHKLTELSNVKEMSRNGGPVSAAEWRPPANAVGSKAGSNSGNIPNVPNACYILVVGETGTGKSTLINTIVNCFRGGNLENLPHNIKVAIPTRFLKGTEPESTNNSELNVHNVTQSMTVKATAYHVKVPNVGDFVVVDTPGLGDTAGVEQDERNIGVILDAANSCPHLNAIILVGNATNARFGLNVQATMTRLSGTIPDVALENMNYVLTMAQHPSEGNFKVEMAPFQPINVAYMNSAFFSSDPREWSPYSLKEVHQKNWRASMWVIRELFEEIKKLNPVGTGPFALMREQRDHVKHKLHESRLEIEKLQTVQNDILDIEALIRKHKEDER